MLAAASADAWRWQSHVEVWVLVGGIIALSLYVVRVIGPRVVPAGEPVLNRRQRNFLVAGILSLWLASDWPMHDISEEYLYAVHMVQHLLLTFIVPPLFLLATPEWLARLVIPKGGTGDRWLRRLTHPVVAGLMFNGVVALSHWAPVVNESVRSGPLHYAVHVVVVATAVQMWIPVCGPFPERRMSLPGQMVYLFAMSIIPTIPAGWLTFAEGAVYEAYDTPFRLWGLTVTEDQQAAGLIMKLVGGFYLWGIITTIFFRWAHRHHEAEQAGIDVDERDILTYEAVQEEFARTAPAPSEPPAHR